MMMQCKAILTTATLLIIVNAVYSIRIIQVTDTHIGEGCGGELDVETCKPSKALEDAVAKINLLVPLPEAVLLTGDITSSALLPEFQKANEIMSKLLMPFFPILGNHDSWPYTRSTDGTFTQTPTPIGDQFFAQVFQDRLTEGDKGKGNVSVRAWPTASCVNGNFGFQTWHHNFIVEFKSLPDLKVIALDWTARGNALPEPGVGPEAELHDYPCGTLPWLQTQLRAFASEASESKRNATRFFIGQHHPYHNREAFSPFGRNEIKNFTFDNIQSAQVQDVFSASFSPDTILGIVAGHMHRWFYGDAWTRFTALDSEWMKVKEWETSACKGWDVDADFVSAITIFDFSVGDDKAPFLSNVDYMWKAPQGQWIGKPSISREN